MESNVVGCQTDSNLNIMTYDIFDGYLTNHYIDGFPNACDDHLSLRATVRVPNTKTQLWWMILSQRGKNPCKLMVDIKKQVNIKQCRDVTTRKFMVQPLWWWGRFCPPGWNRFKLKVSENLRGINSFHLVRLRSFTRAENYILLDLSYILIKSNCCMSR